MESSPSNNINTNNSSAVVRERVHVPYAPCRSVDCYKKLYTINEGTFGVVYCAQDKETNEIVALKKIKMERENEGFPLTSVREMKALMELRHENIVTVKEVVLGKSLKNVFMVMEYIEHDLRGLMECTKKPFLQSEVKTLLLHLLQGVKFMHENWVIHRDLKTTNLLYTNNGILKIGDFGSARDYGSPRKDYTDGVCTLWYRAPELLLGTKSYSTGVDMWSVGCIFAEILSREILIPGSSDIDQLDKIFKLFGTPNDQNWPGFLDLPLARRLNLEKQPFSNLKLKFSHITDSAFDLLSQFLLYDPEKRISASDALEHPYFQENPQPRDPLLMPRYPSSHKKTDSQI